MPRAEVTDVNQHTAWVNRNGFKFSLVYLVIASVLLSKAFLTDSWCRSFNVAIGVHAVFSYFFLHWIKGLPEGGGGIGGPVGGPEASKLTFWEQIDGGYYGTPARRFLIVFPLLFFFVATHACGEDMHALAFNALCTAVCLIPKLEILHRWRFLGINE